jgi:hypothetical protein
VRDAGRARWRLEQRLWCCGAAIARRTRFLRNRLRGHKRHTHTHVRRYAPAGEEPAAAGSVVQGGDTAAAPAAVVPAAHSAPHCYTRCRLSRVRV